MNSEKPSSFSLKAINLELLQFQVHVNAGMDHHL